jgi:uncharacterized membrane protein
MTLQALHFSKITKFKSYKYSLNHQGKWFTIFIIYCIHIFLIISLHNLIVKLFFYLKWIKEKEKKEKIKAYKLKD